MRAGALRRALATPSGRPRAGGRPRARRSGDRTRRRGLRRVGAPREPPAASRRRAGSARSRPGRSSGPRMRKSRARARSYHPPQPLSATCQGRVERLSARRRTVLSSTGTRRRQEMGTSRMAAAALVSCSAPWRLGAAVTRTRRSTPRRSKELDLRADEAVPARERDLAAAGDDGVGSAHRRDSRRQLQRLVAHDDRYNGLVLRQVRRRRLERDVLLEARLLRRLEDEAHRFGRHDHLERRRSARTSTPATRTRRSPRSSTASPGPGRRGNASFAHTGMPRSSAIRTASASASGIPSRRSALAHHHALRSAESRRGPARPAPMEASAG